MQQSAANIARGAPAISGKPISSRPDGSFDEVIVGFVASLEARKLNGTYIKKSGVQVNGRPIYARGREHIVFLDDGCWAIKEGPGGNAGADVYAYVEDSATEPFNVRKPWFVMDDRDGFMTDISGKVTPSFDPGAEDSGR